MEGLEQDESLVDEVKDMIALLDAKFEDGSGDDADGESNVIPNVNGQCNEMNNQNEPMILEILPDVEDLSSAGSVSSIDSPTTWRKKNLDSETDSHPGMIKATQRRIYNVPVKRKYVPGVQDMKKRVDTRVIDDTNDGDDADDDDDVDDDDDDDDNNEERHQAWKTRYSSKPKVMPLLHRHYDCEPKIGILTANTDMSSSIAKTATREQPSSSTSGIEHSSLGMDSPHTKAFKERRDRFPEAIIVPGTGDSRESTKESISDKESQASKEPSTKNVARDDNKIPKLKIPVSAVAAASSGYAAKDDLSLEDFLETLKYLRKSPKVGKKNTFKNLWRKRWQNEIKAATKHSTASNLPRKKLISRLREAAMKEKLFDENDFTTKFCLFELIFSVAWTDRGSTKSLSALEYQSSQIRACRKEEQFSTDMRNDQAPPLRTFNASKDTTIASDEIIDRVAATVVDSTAQSAQSTTSSSSLTSKKRNSNKKGTNDTDNSNRQKPKKVENLSEEDTMEDAWNFPADALIFCVSSRPEIDKVVRHGAFAAFRSTTKNSGQGSVDDEQDRSSGRKKLPYLLFHNSNRRSLKSKGFWNVLWTWERPNIDFDELLVWQKVNHFPDSFQLTRKDLMKFHVERYASNRLGSDFCIIPETYALPQELGSCVAAVTRSNSVVPWIVKPNKLSRGRGIYLVNHPDMIPKGDDTAVVVSRYIPNPLLLDGFKFDLRLYVLVTSFQPLEVYIYKKGFSRLASKKYTRDLDSLDDAYIHITNSSIQTENKRNENKRGNVHKCKLTLEETLALLRRAHSVVDTAKLLGEIHRVVLAAIVSMNHVVSSNPNCFELFGFDVLIDDRLKPWLIEVNSSPSLKIESLIDFQIKRSLIRDVLRLINPCLYDRKKLASLFLRRMKTGQWSQSMPRSTLELRQQINDELQHILTANFESELHDNHTGDDQSKEVVPGDFVRLAPSPLSERLQNVKEKIEATATDRLHEDKKCR